MKLSGTLGLVALLLLVTLIGQGCRQARSAQAETPPTVEATPEPAGAEAGGARLWEENCARCHNYRRPSSRSDSEWAIIMHHMRVRANLTAEEHRKITRFLQAAN
ncbi:MAG: hypothetical protein ACYTDU_15465 [Planctomycetota bacterium]|jgi:mono/diheme cytochrome c family protein